VAAACRAELWDMALRDGGSLRKGDGLVLPSLLARSFRTALRDACCGERLLERCFVLRVEYFQEVDLGTTGAELQSLLQLLC